MSCKKSCGCNDNISVKSGAKASSDLQHEIEEELMQDETKASASDQKNVFYDSMVKKLNETYAKDNS